MKKPLYRFRHWIQAGAGLLQNAHLTGFFTGKLYGGRLKNLCVPGLNCYSCPGALGACPIGSLQAVAGSARFRVSFYVLGFLLLFGVLLGRLICGFLCLFGFLQDLLYKIPGKKWKVPGRVDKPLRYLKYGMLAVPVVVLPLLLTDRYGMSAPYFCKWICPAGTLEGGIPMLLHHETLRAMVGGLFSWKLLLLLLVLVLSIKIYRPFCKYICPLGAFYGLFNRLSFYRMWVDKSRCTDCGACEGACGMGVAVRQQINSPECIRCGACRAACPTGAVRGGFCAGCGRERS